MGRVPVVFSVPEQTDGSGGMFPKQFLEELNIHQIRYMKHLLTLLAIRLI
jgi:hypothetical protein